MKKIRYRCAAVHNSGRCGIDRSFTADHIRVFGTRYRVLQYAQEIMMEDDSITNVVVYTSEKAAFIVQRKWVDPKDLKRS
ncbi:MAG: hypothetical protein V4721_12475 [Bacteroidota bacterium]